MASHTDSSTRRGRPYSKTSHRNTVRHIRTWMRRNAVTDAGRIPYSATLTGADGTPVLLGRRIARVRKAKTEDKLPSAIAQLYERLPAWSWKPTHPQSRYTRTRTIALPDLLKRWMHENDISSAAQIPYTATLELDDQTRSIGRSLDWVRRRHNAGELPTETATLFERLPGWTWTPPRQRAPGQQRNPTP